MTTKISCFHSTVASQELSESDANTASLIEKEVSKFASRLFFAQKWSEEDDRILDRVFEAYKGLIDTVENKGTFYEVLSKSRFDSCPPFIKQALRNYYHNKFLETSVLPLLSEAASYIPSGGAGDASLETKLMFILRNPENIYVASIPQALRDKIYPLLAKHPFPSLSQEGLFSFFVDLYERGFEVDPSKSFGRRGDDYGYMGLFRDIVTADGKKISLITILKEDERLKRSILTALSLFPRKEQNLRTIQILAEIFLYAFPTFDEGIIEALKEVGEADRAALLTLVSPYLEPLVIRIKADISQETRRKRPLRNLHAEIIRYCNSQLTRADRPLPTESVTAEGALTLPVTLEEGRKRLASITAGPMLPLTPDLVNPPFEITEDLKPAEITRWCSKIIYHGYNAEGIRDYTWGCAWRVYQTMLSYYGIHVSIEELIARFGNRENILALWKDFWPERELLLPKTGSETLTEPAGNRDKNYVPFERPMLDADNMIGQLIFHYYGIDSKLERAWGLPLKSPDPLTIFGDYAPLKYVTLRQMLVEHFSDADCGPVALDNGITGEAIIGIGELPDGHLALWIADPHILEGINLGKSPKEAVGYYLVELDEAGIQVRCSLKEQFPTDAEFAAKYYGLHSSNSIGFPNTKDLKSGWRHTLLFTKRRKAAPSEGS